MAPPKLLVGTLTVRGSVVEFRPAHDADWEAPRGSDVAIELAYDFAEARVAKERCVVTFRVAIGRRILEPQEVQLEDRPVLPDATKGVLRHVARMEEAATDIAYSVTAEYRAGPWTGRGRGEAADFRREGRVAVRVR